LNPKQSNCTSSYYMKDNLLIKSGSFLKKFFKKTSTLMDSVVIGIAS
jgi:hypothetical protein